jgi:hypothetical protein
VPRVGATDREDGLRCAVHEVGSRAPVRVDVDEAGRDESRLDGLAAVRSCRVGAHRDDSAVLAEHATALEQAVGKDHGAAQEKRAHAPSESQ